MIRRPATAAPAIPLLLRRALMILAAATVLFFSLYFLDRWWVTSEIEAARHAVREGEQLWPVEMQQHVLRAEAASIDKGALAERLAGDKDGSLCAEGMLMLLRHPARRTKQLLESHLDDKRVNFMLYTNSDLAKICLTVLSIEGRPDQTKQENEFVKKWLRPNSDFR